MKTRAGLLGFAVFGFALLVGGCSVEAAGRSPEQTVEGYLSAMQGHRFAEAFDYVSDTMRAGKPRELWAKEQQYIVQISELKIFEFKVFPSVMVGERAKVPNILRSQDKFLNQLGLDEHEIYELVKEDGEWRIDQQTIAQGDEKEEFFRSGAGQN